MTAATVYMAGPLAGKIARKIPALNTVVAAASARVAMARGTAGATTRIGVEGGKEALQEMLEQVGTDVAQYALRSNSTFREFRNELFTNEWWKNLAYTGLVGGAAGGAFRAGGEATGAIARRFGISEQPSRREAREFLESVGITGNQQQAAVRELNLNTQDGRERFARRLLSGDEEIQQQ